ncbi:MAG: hypothetical protein Q4C13_03145 [Clostridia bacterium]|nr:hypothetical protein [Clostridia bacterium]
MAYEPTGVMTMFPIYLARLKAGGESRESFDIGVAQNEANLNQNFETIYQKLAEMEEYLSGLE